MKTAMIALGFKLLSVLPVERIIAALFSSLLQRLFDKDDKRVTFDNVQKTIGHCLETVSLMNSVLEDCEVSKDEVVTVRDSIVGLKVRLIDIWANGQSGKELEKKLEDK